jgi:hypothetical protein
MTALRIHTHCQVAQKSQCTDQNLSKSMAAPTHEKTAHEKTKISALIEAKRLIIKECQQVTLYIKHLAESAKFKRIAFNKLTRPKKSLQINT